MVNMQDRRDEVRMLCADVLEVSWADTSGKKDQAIGLLEDISASGACIQLETPVPLDSLIMWDSPNQRFTGYVRYCVYREIGYFVGVEFTPGVKWSESAFHPQHLLDVRHLDLQKRHPARPNKTSDGFTIH